MLIYDEVDLCSQFAYNRMYLTNPESTGVGMDTVLVSIKVDCIVSHGEREINCGYEHL